DAGHTKFTLKSSGEVPIHLSIPPLAPPGAACGAHRRGPPRPPRRRLGASAAMTLEQPLGALVLAALVTALACAVVAGVFFAFSGFVMRALSALPPADAATAMQSINRTAVRPPLMIALFGTAAAVV